MKKKIMVTALMAGSLFSGYVLAADSSYLLVAHNSYAMTLTRLARANTLEQCNAAKENFEKNFTKEDSISFKCIPIPPPVG